MTSRVQVDDDEQIIADLLKENRRLRSVVAAQLPIWVPSSDVGPDIFTVASPSDDTHTLTYLPFGINGIYLNGLLLQDGTDYTLDYTTGTFVVSETLVTDDLIEAHYVTTGHLIAATLPPETDTAIIVQSAVATGSGTGVTATLGATPTVGNILVAVISKYSPRSVNPNPGTGWTGQTIGTSTSGNASVEVETRTVQTGDGTTWTFDELFGFTDGFSVGLFEIANSDATPSGWGYSTQGASSSPLSQSVTETAGHLLLVGCCPNGGTSVGGLTTMAPSGYTQSQQIVNSASDSLIIGHTSATGGTQSIDTAWDGSNGDAIQVVITVPGA